MDKNEKWLQWAAELQSIAQAGLFYGKDPFDRERYQRIRDIAAEMISFKTEIPLEKVKDLFCCEQGYQTPKLDTRAAIFKEDKILLVREKNGTWSLPGGWVDVNVSVRENVIKEVKEEAGLDVRPELVIAVQDREKHNLPVYAYKVCKIFLSMHIKSVRFLSFALLAAESFRKTLRLQRAVILDGMNFQGLPKKRIIKNRSRCVLRPVTVKTGRH